MIDLVDWDRWVLLVDTYYDAAYTPDVVNLL